MIASESADWVYASYPGDTNFTPANSDVLTFAKTDQAPLTITSTTGAYGTAIPLTTSGGSSTGALGYSLDAGGTASGCALTAGSLSSTSVGTCLVTATKAGDTNYNPVSSSDTTITFTTANQAALSINSISGTYGTPIKLHTAGGSGTGGVTYVVDGGTASGCTVSVSTPYTLSSTSVGTCLVTATKAGDTNYNPVSSSDTTITFTTANQAALSINSISGTYGTPIKLHTAGGSGTGGVTYVVDGGTASGCTVSVSTPYTLSSTSVGTCLVTATKAGDTNYNPVSSSDTTITFTTANQAALSINSISGTYGTPIKLHTAGGSGTGGVTYVVDGGTASGCTVSVSTPYTLSSTSVGTCLVTATKAGDTNYNRVLPGHHDDVFRCVRPQREQLQRRKLRL